MQVFSTSSAAGRRRALTVCAALATWFLAGKSLAIVGPAREGQALAGHVVSVLIREARRAGFCSGVVMADKVVLTAGHCAKRAGDMRVFYRDAADAPVFLEVQAVALHPGFKADAIARRLVSVDLALIQTAKPLDPRFSAPDLETNVVALGQPLVAAGFGVALEGEQASAGVLREIGLTARAPLSSRLVWANDRGGAGGGACTGDSGGPIMTGDGARLLAIIAWSAGEGGRHCGALTQGILVAPVRDWLRATIQGWSR